MKHSFLLIILFSWLGYYSSYSQTVEEVDYYANLENDAVEALENTCTLLKVTYPIIYKDRDYLPTLEDILKSEYFCDEPEDPFSEEPWNPDDEEHELSYYVIYEET